MQTNQVKTIDLSKTIQGTLKRLPFVNILGVQYKKHERLNQLPHHQLNLIDTMTAERARVLVRFEECTFDSGYDAATATSLVKYWLEQLLNKLNNNDEPTHYKFATDGGTQSFYRLPMMAQAHARGAPPSRWSSPHDVTAQQVYLPVPTPSAADMEEMELLSAANAVLRAMSDSMFNERESLTVRTASHVDGGFTMSFDAHLGSGVTFSAQEATDSPSLDEFQRSVSERDLLSGRFSVNGTGYVYSVGHRHGFASELTYLISPDALEAAFNRLWAAHHTQLGVAAAPVLFSLPF